MAALQKHQFPLWRDVLLEGIVFGTMIPFAVLAMIDDLLLILR
jgi:hypothetical protein